MRIVVSAVLLVLVAAACTQDQQTPVPEEKTGPILIFAASSAADVVEELAATYEALTGTPVQASFASSATLAQQIENGASAAVFLSAHVEWVDYLERKGLVAERRDLLENRMVLVTPASMPGPIHSLDDLRATQGVRVAIGDPESVPAGTYAKQALTALGLWDSVEGSVVPAHTVRQVLLYVEQGEVDAGVVYATDAKASQRVRIVAELDPSLSDPVVYPLVLLDKESTPAKAFFDYLCGPEAGAVFQRYGFVLHSGTKE
ncbi:MAG: molybdate ABC transporter substrate-binding protein [Candidatus Hydrogenedentes bacterium]|nr:molybdate ABC transporter substrate-binding protein [Candidatus Hydrogenedentota bacterium]